MAADVRKDGSESSSARQREADEDGRVELRLEALADEIAQIIDAQASGRDRDALQDFAVSLIRDRQPAAASAGEELERIDDAHGTGSVASARRGSNAATLIGYGFLLLPASGVILLVFPPVGGLLGVMALGMMGIGVVTGLLARLFPRPPVS